MARGRKKKTTTKFSRKSILTAERAHYGDEPTWENIDSIEDKSLVWLKTCNWYNICSHRKQWKKWVVEYLKTTKNTTHKKLYALVKSLPESSFDRRTAQMSRIISLGGKDIIPPYEMTEFSENLVRLFTEASTKLMQKKKAEQKMASSSSAGQKIETKPNPQMYMQRAADSILEELEPLLDALYENPKAGEKKIDLYSILQRNEIKGRVVTFISNPIESRLKEMKKALNNDDESIVEGYEYLTKPQKKIVVNTLTQMLEDCERQKKATKKLRTRKRAPKSKIDLLKSFKTKDKDDDYKLVGAAPSSIIGAKSAIFFNCKTKKLIVLHLDSTNHKGLSIKGTKVVNIDTSKSIEIALRKPLETLAKVKSGKIRAINNTIKDLTTKPKEATGKVNSHCVLVKVLK